MVSCLCAVSIYIYNVYLDICGATDLGLSSRRSRPIWSLATVDAEIESVSTWLSSSRFDNAAPKSSSLHREQVSTATTLDTAVALVASPGSELGEEATTVPITITPNMNSTPVEVTFDPYGIDTMVYVHIQKTGGSEFLEHLVTAQITSKRFSSLYNLSKRHPTLMHSWTQRHIVPLCQTSHIGGWKRDSSYLGNGKTIVIHHEMCPRSWERPKGETWLVSEKTTAWTCGVHAFYTDFKRCLKDSTTFNLMAKRKYGEKVGLLSKHNNFHYVVILRHPLLRYVSEYLHVSRGACWERKYVCNGQIQKRQPPIFGCPEHFHCSRKQVKNFVANLTLNEFVSCQDSWSINRMTLALANNDEATCWNKTRYTSEERDKLLLISAKSNLLNFSYFGISEFSEDSGMLFEKTFKVVLRSPVQQLSLNISKAGQFIESLMLDKNVFKQVINNNHLDLELYKYALEIFQSRMRTIGRQLDPDTLKFIQTLNDITLNQHTG